MTQPVFDPAIIPDLDRATRHLEVPVFLAIVPLVSHRNTAFLHDEVPAFVFHRIFYIV